MNNAHKRDLIIFSMVSFAIYVAIVIVSPMAGEDYGLTRLFHNESFSERLLFAIEKSHIQMAGWNARLGEQVAIFELSIPRWMSLIIYSLSFVAFSITVGMLSSKDDHNHWKRTSAYVAGLTFLLWPGMEVFFWKTANSGYLQTMILTMLVVIPYSGRFYIESLSKRKVLFLAYLFICLLAGFSFENVPFAVAISLTTLCLWEKRKAVINYLPIVATLSGWFALITSDSTTIRMAYYAKAIPKNNNPVIHYWGRFTDVVGSFFETSSILFFLSVLSIIYLGKNKLIKKYHACLILASVLVVGSMLASPYTEARSFLFAWCVMFSIFCYGLSKLIEKLELVNFPLVLLFLSACFGIYTLCIYSSYGEKLNSREDGIIRAIGTDKCIKGYEIGIIKDNHGYRYVNNRDEWYFYNMIGKGDYYGCNITNIK